MNHQILECRGIPATAERGGAYGCAHKQDVIVLIENNIIDRCSTKDPCEINFHPLTVARDQYVNSMSLGGSFDFESWTTVCNFSESDITEAPKKVNDEL